VEQNLAKSPSPIRNPQLVLLQSRSADWPSYGDIHAVRGIDFEIQSGEVFGLLGPNGAGKTTGRDPRRASFSKRGRSFSSWPRSWGQSKQLKDRIDVCLQSTHFPEAEGQDAFQFDSLYSRAVNGRLAQTPAALGETKPVL
jgi:hypothetical protein